MTQASNTSGPRINRIVVKRLFGWLDYDIPATQSADGLGNIAILYGDNGSGKTTILKLIFHLLSPAINRGHRTALREIPFERVDISLSDGTTVTASRDNEIRGSYRLLIQNAHRRPLEGMYYALDESGKFESEEFERRFTAGLQEIGLTLYFLSDDRRISSDALPTATPHVRMAETFALTRWALTDRENEEAFAVDRKLSEVIEMAQGWIRAQAIKGSNTGSQNANTIYLEIIQRIARARTTADSDVEKVRLVTDGLHDLSERTKGFAKYGFVPALNADEILSLISSTPAEKQETIAAILEPYVDGLKARLDGLMGIQRMTEVFIDHLNEFFSNKVTKFSLSAGFEFEDVANLALRPEWLSSGERHLLLLFCYALLSREQSSSVFMVDEPELSLNVKWQRKLIASLTDLVAGSSNQFLFATHSMEILSQHRHAVVPLVSRRG
jgi:energy-coupling factor transporter ATP-binding protein EcfA2